MNLLTSRLHHIVRHRIAAGSLSVPSLPIVTIQILGQLQRPDVNLSCVAELIGRDPGLTSKLLRISRSAVFGGRADIQTLDQVTTLLGVSRLRAAVVEVAARKLFRSRDATISQACDRLWEHSLAVGLLTRELVRVSGAQIDSEASYLAGLLHDVGKPLVAGLLLDAERQLIAVEQEERWVDGTAWIACVDELHRSLGVYLANSWNLPACVKAAISDSDGFDLHSALSIGNLVRTADCLALREGISLWKADPCAVQGGLLVGAALIGVDIEYLEELAIALPERVREHLSA
ncbi:MAG: HDOD domain-containing protein [Planctomycetes bacterium]|nr:HDOD domain-containing protein [Planctomycetota bacterium]